MPPQIIDHPSTHWSNRNGQPIIAVVVHGTAGSNSLDYLTKNDRMVSIHALIEKNGTIYRMVSDDRAANHAGAPTSSFTLNGKTYTSGQVNQVTLGVELENMQDGRDPYTDPQLAALGWQLADWRRQYGPLPILRHADLDPTRRRDPYQLTTQTMEQWAAKYMTPPTPPPTKRYRVKRTLISTRQDGQPPYAGELQPGEEVVADKWYSDNGGTVHLQDGRGFVLLSELEAV